MIEKLKKSPINYFSDLCMLVIAIVWILEVIIMTGSAIYSMVVNCDSYVWSEVQLLATAPITAGIFMWGLKNAGTHVMKAYKGEEVPEDFQEDSPESEEIIDDI